MAGEPYLQIGAGTEVGLYRIIEPLGQGGMATVFKARHTVLNRDAALKFLHPAFLEDPEFVRRFRHEARIIAGLEHPNIVPIFDFAEHQGLPYLAMKFIQGETLKARLSRTRMSREEACRIVEAVGKGLAYAHDRGILHRDVKPSNILIADSGEIYLADFGIARIAASAQSTLSREMLIGTPQYISPEQARSEPDLDSRTDIYSFGVVLYELLVGQVPFDADTPISVIHDHLYTPPPKPSTASANISEALESVILRALAKRREDRFDTAGELTRAFLDAAALPGSAPVQAQSETLEPLDAETAAADGEQEAPLAAESEHPAMGGMPGQGVLVSSRGLAFPLFGQRLLVGREDPRRGVSPDIDLTEAEPLDAKSGRRRRTVHREQAWITWAEGEWRVEAIPGKEERAWLNDHAMETGQRYALRAGDRLKFGGVELEFRLRASPSDPEGDR